ncbi:MAG: hypothetical protein NZ872_05285 [Archaeoglobaceae archaeon]|nr:hypothetical protein [Archaeoglobaceae archaeon]MDW8128611.1 hypothetical protein [Archaeoglobaceae archaeon]
MKELFRELEDWIIGLFLICLAFWNYLGLSPFSTHNCDHWCSYSDGILEIE